MKKKVLHVAMSAYAVGEGSLLGLLLRGNMMIQAYTWSGEGCEVYLPLHNKDLSEIADLFQVLKALNAFLHNNCMEMTQEMRSTLPIVRSRSSSVVSTPSYGGSEHGYFLRSRGPV